MHFISKRIETTATIDQQKHRQRQSVLTKVRDLLFRAIFEKQEVFFLQTAHHARSFLLQHQRIDGDEIDVNLDDVCPRQRGHLVCARLVRVRTCLRSVVCPNSPLARLARHQERQEKEAKRHQDCKRD